jgi:uncharacterized SAM-binding protein YcdF (DUF218 family)
MSGSSEIRSHPATHWIVRIASLALFSLLAFVLVTSVRIVRQAGRNEARPAGAIVVFGAAEYVGKPSPVYRARLEHALQLYSEGLAPLVITTGGAGDPKYTEGGVGRDYLISRGVPDRYLIAETQGEDTAESAGRMATIMHANGIRDCVAVSDAYHIFRAKKMLEAEGITAYGAPRPDSVPHSSAARTVAVLREAFSYMLWTLHIT